MTVPCAGRVATVITTALAMAAAPAPAIAGPGEAGRGQRTVDAGGPDLAGVDYVVLVWYRRDDALGTFAYQTYDARKGEYTAAVDHWIEQMRQKYPRYEVRVHRVDLARERGATEQLKVGSVIQRELILAAARSGVVLGAPMRLGPGPAATQRLSPMPRVGAQAPGAGGSSYINLPGPSTPFPFPYVRPRP